MMWTDNSADAVDALCYGRMGIFEFGPFTLTEFVHLERDQSLPDELEFRVDGTELWWNWKSIAALGSGEVSTPLGPLGDWFTRHLNHIAGPLTVLDVTRQLESGALSALVEVQIGDGAWSPVIDLLVAPEPTAAIAVGPVASIVAQERPVEVASSETLPPADEKKQQLEAWLSKTMPDRAVTVAVVPRQASPTTEAVFAAALVGVAEQADQAARRLSAPWIWGTLACVVLATLALAFLQPRGVDELDLTALRKLKSVHEAIKALRASQPDEAVWTEFTAELTQDLDPLKQELARRKRANTPIKESLYWAMEFRLPRIFKEGRLQPSPAEAEFAANLREAERHVRQSRR